MALIILEGPDGGGKSVMASKIHDEFELPIIHPGKPPLLESETSGLVFQQLIRAMHKSKWFVYDRCTSLSEFVYSRFNPEKCLWPNYRSILFGHLLSLRNTDTVFIYCRTDTDRHIESCVRSDTDDEQSYELAKSRMVEICAAYDTAFDIMDTLGFDIMTFDWHKESDAELIEALK